MLRAGVGAWRSVEDAAVAINILEAENTEEIPPSAMLPDMLECIRVGVPGFTTAEQERPVLTSRTLKHKPVVRYTLRNCLVHRAGVE